MRHKFKLSEYLKSMKGLRLSYFLIYVFTSTFTLLNTLSMLLYSKPP